MDESDKSKQDSKIREKCFSYLFDVKHPKPGNAVVVSKPRLPIGLNECPPMQSVLPK